MLAASRAGVLRCGGGWAGQQQQQQQRPAAAPRAGRPGGLRQCACGAKRGRPRKTDAVEAPSPPSPPQQQQPSAEAAAAVAEPPRRGRGRQPRQSAEAEPAPAPVGTPPAAGAAGAAGAAHADHERVISYEMDITSSVELDYTEDRTLVVPSYTHQAQGHDSNDAPPLDDAAFLAPDLAGGSGFVGEEAQDAAAAAAAGAPPAAAEAASPASAALSAIVARAAAAGAAREAAEAAEGDEDDPFRGTEEPPGLYEYEAGLPFADTLAHEPEHKLQAMPREWRPRSRAEADTLLRWVSWETSHERHERQLEYEDLARYYMCLQNSESENIYSTTKAMSVVTAEVELEDAESGNRVDTVYPVWARAEHRWYPSGRFARYNQYVKDNIGSLTAKFAPGADQEEEFDLLDDAFLLADDDASSAGGGPASAALRGGDGGPAALQGPAAGLALDAFLAGVLPGTASSELGASYYEEVAAPAAAQEEEDTFDEELEQ